MGLRVYVLLASAAVLIGGLAHLAACSDFEPTDTAAGADAGGEASSADGSSADDSSVDGGVDSSACPPFAALCDGGVPLECTNAAGRCYAFCPELLSREIAALRCAAWGGCLAGVTSAPVLNCLQTTATGRSAPLFVDLVQDAAADARAEGWVAACPGATQPSSISWRGTEPDDGNDAGTETGKEQCAVLMPSGGLVDTGCLSKNSFVCERPQ